MTGSYETLPRTRCTTITFLKRWIINIWCRTSTTVIQTFNVTLTTVCRALNATHLRHRIILRCCASDAAQSVNTITTWNLSRTIDTCLLDLVIEFIWCCITWFTSLSGKKISISLTWVAKKTFLLIYFIVLVFLGASAACERAYHVATLDITVTINTLFVNWVVFLISVKAKTAFVLGCHISFVIICIALVINALVWGNVPCLRARDATHSFKIIHAVAIEATVNTFIWLTIVTKP